MWQFLWRSRSSNAKARPSVSSPSFILLRCSSAKTLLRHKLWSRPVRRLVSLCRLHWCSRYVYFSFDAIIGNRALSHGKWSKWLLSYYNAKKQTNKQTNVLYSLKKNGAQVNVEFTLGGVKRTRVTHDRRISCERELIIVCIEIFRNFGWPLWLCSGKGGRLAWLDYLFCEFLWSTFNRHSVPWPTPVNTHIKNKVERWMDNFIEFAVFCHPKPWVVSLSTGIWEENRGEWTFAKTSGTVAREGKNWPVAD